MKPMNPKASLRCAVYTRVSTEHGLEQEFNSLDNQREASEAYIKSQAHEGWRLMRDRYDDGGFSGGSMERPALKKLLDAVRARRIDVIVVYKVDRLTRCLRTSPSWSSSSTNIRCPSSRLPSHLSFERRAKKCLRRRALFVCGEKIDANTQVWRRLEQQDAALPRIGPVLRSRADKI